MCTATVVSIPVVHQSAAVSGLCGRHAEQEGAKPSCLQSPTCRYLCNLGVPRRSLRSIEIKTSSCHIQVSGPLSALERKQQLACRQSPVHDPAALPGLCRWRLLQAPITRSSGGQARATMVLPSERAELLKRGRELAWSSCLALGLFSYTHADVLYLLLPACSPPQSPPTVTEHVVHNTTTGCQEYSLHIAVNGTQCMPSSVPGKELSCEEQCALVSDASVASASVAGSHCLMPGVQAPACLLHA